MFANVLERDKILLAEAIPLECLSKWGLIGLQRGIRTLTRLGFTPVADRIRATERADCGPISVCLLLRQPLSPTPASACVHKPVGSGDSQAGINFALLSERFVRGLINLNLAWWANPRFLPTHGDLSALLYPEIEVSQIPFGVETLWYDYHNERHGELNLPDCWPRWFDNAYGTLCDFRKDMFRCSVQGAIDFLWLHELGHIFCGHFSSIKPWETLNPGRGLGALSLVGAASPSPSTRRDSDLRRAFEIEADSWAMTRLISQLADEDSDKLHSRSSVVRGLSQARAAMVGVLSALIGWDYYRLLTGGVDAKLAILDSAYPPLWFRVDNCLSCFELAVRNKLFKSSEVHELSSAAQLHLTVTQLGNVHPFVAVCLGTPLDPMRRLLRDRVLKNAQETSNTHWKENESVIEFKVRKHFMDLPG